MSPRLLDLAALPLRPGRQGFAPSEDDGGGKMMEGLGDMIKLAFFVSVVLWFVFLIWLSQRDLW